MLSENSNIHIEFKNVTAEELGFNEATTRKCKEIKHLNKEDTLNLPYQLWPKTKNESKSKMKLETGLNQSKIEDFFATKKVNNGTVT